MSSSAAISGRTALVSCARLSGFFEKVQRNGLFEARTGPARVRLR